MTTRTKEQEAERRAKRRVMDAYLTPPKYAAALVRQLTPLIGTPESVLEPSAGAGAFVQAAFTQWPRCMVTAVEPRKRAFNKLNNFQLAHLTKPLQLYNDTIENTVEKTTLWGQGGLLGRHWDLIIGNPPYSKLEAHVHLLVPAAKYTAFLLRLSFLGSQQRARTLWVPDYPHRLRWLIPLAERPSFTNKGSDNSEYALFVWQRFWRGNAEILAPLWVES